MTFYYVILAAALGMVFGHWGIPFIAKILDWSHDADPDYQVTNALDRIHAMMHVPDAATGVQHTPRHDSAPAAASSSVPRQGRHASDRPAV